MGGMDVEAAVLSGEEISEFRLTDEIGAMKGVDEAGAEEFGERGEVLPWHAVEAARKTRFLKNLGTAVGKAMLMSN